MLDITVKAVGPTRSKSENSGSVRHNQSKPIVNKVVKEATMPSHGEEDRNQISTMIETSHVTTDNGRTKQINGIMNDGMTKAHLVISDSGTAKLPKGTEFNGRTKHLEGIDNNGRAKISQETRNN